eukprot:1557732-Pleurochrysis_carterae.AAC.1
MRKLLAGARGLTSQWLAVAIPREANGDADRLSHPAKLEEMLRDARSAGLQARVARIPGQCWAAMRAAMEEAPGADGASKRRRRR